MSATRYHSIAQFFAQPLLLAPSAVEPLILDIQEQVRCGIFDDDDEDEDGPVKPYLLTDSGIAVITVFGPTVRRGCWWCRASYAAIQASFDAALEDPACKGIVLDIDSPGGEAGGVFDLSDRIFAARGKKPVFASADLMMASAAYAIGSAAERLYVARDGRAGSIGVVCAHVDMSKMLADAGVKVTYIQAGAKKTFGNPTEPLSKPAREEIQADVDLLYDLFVKTVARNRGMVAESVRATEAGMFTGADAVAAGLCDRLGTFEGCMRDMADLIGAPASSPSEGGDAPAQDDDDEPMPMPMKGAAEPAPPLADSAPPIPLTPIHITLTEDSSTLDVLDHMEGERLALAIQSGAEVLSCLRCSASAPEFAGSASRKLSMLVVPYGAASEDLGGYVEVYEPGCFKDGLSGDPKVLWQHDPKYVLGSAAAGTARFWEASDGVHVEADAPQTQWADDLLTSMRRKDVSGSSAAFFILKYRWGQHDGRRARIVTQALMREASVANFPIYPRATAKVGPGAAAPEFQYRNEHLRARLELLKIT